MREVTYNGNDIFGDINFGMYGNDEDIDVVKSMEMIESGFKNEFEEKIRARLKEFDIDLIKFHYFSPKEYNYMTDSLDPTMIGTDPEWKKYIEFVKSNKEEINKRLKANESYDGYMALTKNDADEEIEATKNESFAPDTIIMNLLLSSVIDFSNFEISEYYIWDTNECPEGEDSRNDCDGCVKSAEYECVEGKCKRRDRLFCDTCMGELDENDLCPKCNRQLKLLTY